MIIPTQPWNPNNKPIWQAPLGVMRSIVAFNCRKYGMPQPVLALPLWERSGLKAHDLSNNRIACDLVDSPSTYPTWKQDGLYFNGGGVDTPTLNHNIVTGDFTYFAVIKPDAGGLPTSKTIISNNGSPIFSHNYNNSGELGIDWGATEGSFGCSPAANDISSVAMVRSGTTISGYVDGVAGGTTYTVSTSMANAINYIGHPNYIWVPEQYLGYIYEILIYDVALTGRQLGFISNYPYFMYILPEEYYNEFRRYKGIHLTSGLD